MKIPLGVAIIICKHSDLYSLCFLAFIIPLDAFAAVFSSIAMSYCLFYGISSSTLPRFSMKFRSSTSFFVFYCPILYTFFSLLYLDVLFQAPKTLRLCLLIICCYKNWWLSSSIPLIYCPSIQTSLGAKYDIMLLECSPLTLFMIKNLPILGLFLNAFSISILSSCCRTSCIT